MRKGSWIICVAASMVLALAALPTIEKSLGASPPAVEVKIDNFSFTPPTLTVKAGTQITWTNADDIPHTVVSDDQKRVHVSGHGSGEELKLVLSLIKPKVFVPIHGEYRQLARHARMATLVSPKTTVLMAEDGDVLRFDAEGGRVADRVPTGRVFIDGTRTGEVADEVLRDRKHLAGDGVVVCVVAVNSRTGTVESAPELITRGLSVDSRHADLLRDAPESLKRAIEAAPVEERTDPGLLKERVRIELQRMFRKRAGRRPLVLPVVMEV